jgi:hypothetical protein
MLAPMAMLIVSGGAREAGDFRTVPYYKHILLVHAPATDGDIAETLVRFDGNVAGAVSEPLE